MRPIDQPGNGCTRPPFFRVIHIVAYRDRSFPRNAGIVRALELAPDFALSIAHNQNANWRRYIETWRALRKLRRTVDPDLYLFGFRAHEIFWPFLFSMKGKPIIFDALMSPYAALYEERKLGWLGYLLAPLVFWLERSILRRADMVLTDTAAHIAYYQRTFGLPSSKLCALPVSAPDLEQRPLALPLRAESFTVLFFGSFLPLHGVAVIVQAASQLRDLPIHFEFIGGGKAKQLHTACAAADVKRYRHRPWVPFEELLSKDIPAASLCLGGPFGGTTQGRRVITTKTAQCLAASRATVVGRGEADIGFIDRNNCLLVEQHNPQALADAIRWAFEHQHALAEIGENGRKLYDKQLSTHVIAERLIPCLKALAAGSDAET
ncbi:MAG: glycosyltransferase [Dyella sp.]